jgi:hypothetical protein
MFVLIIEIPIKSCMTNDDENMYHGEQSLVEKITSLKWSKMLLLKTLADKPSGQRKSFEVDSCEMSLFWHNKSSSKHKPWYLTTKNFSAKTVFATFIYKKFANSFVFGHNSRYMSLNRSISIEIHGLLASPLE